jgi:hypothetical protein
MKKSLLAIATIVLIGLVLAVVFFGNNLLTITPNEPTPTPAESSTPTSPTPSPSFAPIETPTQTSNNYAVTLRYHEISRQKLTSNDVTDPNFLNYTFIQISITAKSNDGNVYTLIYDNFYVSVNDVEMTPPKQLSGTWAFNGVQESMHWMMFQDIGTEYELKYRDSSFSIELIKD